MTFCVQCVYIDMNLWGNLQIVILMYRYLGIRHRKCGHVCMYIVNVHKIACVHTRMQRIVAR